MEPSKEARSEAVLATLVLGGGSRFGPESGIQQRELPSADDVLARVTTLLERTPADEVPDRRALAKAFSQLQEHAEPTLRRLAGTKVADAAPLGGDQLGSLEAIIIADGSRPSYLLRNGGSFDANNPFLGQWRDDMLAFAPDLRRLAASVGRIQPAIGNAAAFFGTGTLVDRSKGLVLTNYHVIDAARGAFGITLEGAGNKLKVCGDLVIDFDGECGSTSQNRFRIVEISLPQGFGNSFNGLDAAVARIEPLNGAESRLPEFAAKLSASAAYAQGASPTLVTIGYPGEPETINPSGATVDWSFVVKTLFGNRFGVKRVAPGRFKLGPGQVPDDATGRVMTHDATTFGGASGSLAFAWKDVMSPAYGLHFAGATLGTNYAIALNRAADALSAIGVPLG